VPQPLGSGRLADSVPEFACLAIAHCLKRHAAQYDKSLARLANEDLELRLVPSVQNPIARPKKEVHAGFVFAQ